MKEKDLFFMFNSMKSEEEQLYRTLYGAIAGDALGIPAEFMQRSDLKKNPITDMVNGGFFNLPAGTWSDDSSLLLCLADSISTTKTIDYEDIMKRFKSWFFRGKYTPRGRTFDCGKTCSKAIFRFRHGTPALECGGKEEYENGNGSLMRLAPLPFYLIKRFGENPMTQDECFDVIHNVSKITHAHPISLIGCDIYCAYMIEILKGRDKKELQGYALPIIGNYVKRHPEYQTAFSKYERLFHMNFKDLPENDISSSGYIVDSLEAAIWCFLNTDTYPNCVLKAVNLGSDADTVACIAGSIAGAYYTYTTPGITVQTPNEWILKLGNLKLINKIIKKYASFIFDEA